MSTPFNPYWLEMGAVVPVDIQTTEALIQEINRLKSAQSKRHFLDPSKEQLWDLLVAHRKEPFTLVVETIKLMKEINT